MVLSAGLGTRLGEITKTKPKCLVEAGGKTILEHVFNRLQEAGVSTVVMNLFYLKDVIREYLEKNNNFGLDIQFSDEEQLLGTGGGLYRAKSFFESEKEFFIYNCDVYSDLNLTQLIDYHRAKGNTVTLATMDRKTSRPLLFGKSGNLCGWENTKEGLGEVFGTDPEPKAVAFSGIQVASPKIFDYMVGEETPFTTIRVFLKAARTGEKIGSYDMGSNFWIDMGTPEKLEELRRLLASKEEKGAMN